MLDEPAAPPPDAEPTDVSGGPVPPARRAPLAPCWCWSRDARWVAEYYPVDEVVEARRRRSRVLLRYADPAWLVRLVLGLGGSARLLEPAELAAAVGERARAALARRARRMRRA